MAVNKTGSTKHIATPPEEDQATATAIGNMHEKLMKIGHVVPEGDMVADMTETWARTSQNFGTIVYRR